MPRLTIKPADIETARALERWEYRTHKSVTNFDCCHLCADEWRGKSLAELKEAGGAYWTPVWPEPHGNYTIVGDVEHPSYADHPTFYICEVCQKELGEEDD